ncbi:protein of unknown function [Parapedobacter luteus]|uniref:DUF4859 domain-containing protein n=1 Tax=Parapedobacter luteus TaxID=623280 RepID=A0A1T4ZVZ0_9SPHI|nr:DUF4859 domain-containing protein [Parapedobacter luteus]SKB26872.1 protein of unknown function [Parapedobacter luteus]
MNLKHIWRYGLATLAVVQGCKPDQIGFLNEHLRYNIAELLVTQGTSVSTPPLIANGSSTPMTVELLEIRNKETGAAETAFLQPHEYHVFLEQVGADDTTLEQLEAKIGTVTEPALTVNEIGGKVALTPATEYVPPGSYTLDLKVTNISGTKIYPEVMDITLLPIKPDSVFASSASTSTMSDESATAEWRDYSVTTEYRQTAENRIIYVWEDRDGVRFNPKQGEVVRRASLPSFADWSPFFPEELTDTAIVYEYPFFKGMAYPLKSVARVGSTNYSSGPESHYRIPALDNSIAMNINTMTNTRFYLPGTHIVRYRLNTVRRGLPATTITRDVTLPEGAGYAATAVPMDPDELAGLFGISATEIASLMNTRITFYGLLPDGTLNPNSTAAAPGHWFDASGNTVGWGDDARLFSEFNTSALVFNIGQFPDRNFAGDTFTVRQAMIYRPAGEDAVRVNFVFNITIQ